MVFFDIGGTLLNFSIEPSALFSKILAEHGVTIDPKRLYRSMRQIEASFPLPLGISAASEGAYWRAYDEKILEHVGVQPTAAILDEIFRRFREELTLDCFPESVEVLEALRLRGVPLGVISNASHGILGDLVRNDLTGYFEHVVYSQAVGVAKPDARIFNEALARFGVDAGLTWHVGDSVEADIEGARGVGIHPVLVDRKGQFDTVAVPRLRDLRGLIPMFDGA